MRKRTKKITLIFSSVILAACLAFGVAACGSSKGDPVSDNSSPGQTNPEINDDNIHDSGSEDDGTFDIPDSSDDDDDASDLPENPGMTEDLDDDNNDDDADGDYSDDKDNDDKDNDDGDNDDGGVGESDDSDGEDSSEVQEDENSKGLIYSLNDDKTSYSVTGYGDNLTGIIEVPDMYEGLPVTSIGSTAFYNCTALTEIILPYSVTSIGISAFYGCISLTSIDISDSITSIGIYAFRDCWSLEKIYFNAISLSDLSNNNYVFYNAGRDSVGIAVTIGQNVERIPTYLFCPCSDLSYSPNITSVLFENYGMCRSIGESAFRGCTLLSEIIIPDSVTYIGNAAFYNCTSLESITLPFVGSGDLIDSYFGFIFGAPSYSRQTSYIPSSLTDVTITGGDVEENAFCGCTTLTTVTLCKDVTFVGKSAFSGCGSITEIVLPFVGENSSVTIASSSTLFGYIFGTTNYGGGTATQQYYSDTESEIYYIPDSLTTVTVSGGNLLYGAFYNCTFLTSVTLGADVTFMGDYVFYGCTSLTMITIPDSVTSVGSYAFNDCTSLTSVGISDSVTSIGSYAFCDCSSLMTVEMGDSLCLIDSYSFYNCISLTSISIPESVIIIGDYVFYNCSSLSSVNIGGNVTSIGSGSFGNCNSLVSIIVPDSVVSLGADIFSGCSSLTDITLPFVGASVDATTASNSTLFGYIFGTSRYTGGVSITQYYAFSSSATYYIPSTLISITITGGNILYGAFYNCTSLVSVTIGEGVTSIGYYALYGCTSLTSVTIGSGVTSIEGRAFYNCTYLTEINFNAVAMDDLSSNNYVFYNAGKNGSGITVTIGTEVTKIPAYLFNPFNNSSYTPQITTVIFEKGSQCTSIGNYAFSSCSSLTSITIPNSMTSIGTYAFYGCTYLTEINFNAVAMDDLSYSNYVFYNAGKNGSGITVTIGAGVTKIPAYLFCPYSDISSYAPKISTLVFEDNSQCTSIGSSAFYNCTSLTSITITDCVTLIGGYAFGNCTSLTSIVIPDSVIAIGDGSFRGCTSLKSVSLGNSVTSIGSSAFYNCTSLTSVTIPNSVTSIGSSAFYNCTSLTSITISNSVTSIDSSAFYNCTSLTSIVIPDSVTSIGNDAFYNCTSLTSIVIPNSVTSIGSSAFYNCVSLEEIKFNAVLMNSLSASNYVFSYAGQSSSGITVTIGAEVTKIPAYLFCPYSDSSYSPNIMTVIFEKDSQCVDLGDYAFYNCMYLTDIYFNAVAMDDLLSDNYVFYNAGKNGSGITVTIGAEVTKIPAYLFCPYSSSSSYVPKISTLVFEDNSQCTSIGEMSFYNCTSLTSVTIGSSVTEIDDYAFYGCTYLTEIYFNAVAMDDLSSKNYIFYSAGKNGSGITVTIGTEVTKIPAYLFNPFNNSSYAPKITAVVFEEGCQCKSIGDSAFGYCSTTTNVYLTDFAIWYAIKFVNGSANPLCYGGDIYVNGKLMTAVPDGVTAINNYMFCGWSVSAIVIPESVTSIGRYAFYNCISLTSVTIPDSVTSIADYTFYNCTSLTSMTIPDSVTSIGYGAFPCWSGTLFFCAES